MHYFVFGTDAAVVQNDEQAQKFEAAGWERVEYAEWHAAWQARDAAQVEAMERAVGANVVYPRRVKGE